MAPALLLALAGCRQDMHDQAKYEPLEASPFYADGTSARPLVEGTVPRGFLREDTLLETGLDAAGEFATTIPVPVDRRLLLHGQVEFNTFCSPCHGRLADGQGMIVRRGYKQPSSFHVERLREAQPGYFYDVINKGFGQMPSYASQVNRPLDRWSIVAYIRVLQYSQNVRLADLPEDLARDMRAQVVAAEAARTEAVE